MPNANRGRARGVSSREGLDGLVVAGALGWVVENRVGLGERAEPLWAVRLRVSVRMVLARQAPVGAADLGRAGVRGDAEDPVGVVGVQIYLRRVALPLSVIGRRAGASNRLRVAGGKGPARGRAKLAERAILDLAHALARQPDPLADLAQ